jgi:hypothetical protein
MAAPDFASLNPGYNRYCFGMSAALTSATAASTSSLKNVSN